jgi:hypothetical protein
MFRAERVGEGSDVEIRRNNTKYRRTRWHSVRDGRKVNNTF